MSKVHKIGISKLKGKEIEDVIEVKAIAGKGLENDRFCKNNNQKTSQITLIEKEIIDDFNSLLDIKIPYKSFRRNIITEGIKLNKLINKELIIGNVKIKVHDLCEPCNYLQNLLGQKNLVKNLVHKGGIRCEILTSGIISIGDIIKY
tara:strand:+ start:143 stop:583 length:441 start_codon:yes stop_codon:yes gene_type:complete